MAINTDRPARFSRSDSSILGKWWWTVDRLNLGVLLILIFIGICLNLAASPAVAERIGVESFYFVKKQLTILPIALSLIFFLSLLTTYQVRNFALFLFILAFVFTFFTFFVGAEIKGAQRWIRVLGFSLQPSEFLKPSFIILSAWLFSQNQLSPGFPGYRTALLLLLGVIGLLLAQPDLGMTIVITAVWICQIFLSGLSYYWIFIFGTLGVFGLITSYFIFPHVAHRINSFLDPSYGDKYQINASLESFTRGGLFGQGPGEGMVKERLPDAHSDFIFAVAGEEFGLIFCLILIGIFVFIFIRGLSRVLSDKNLFRILSVSGLLLSFSLQALINMGSSLHMIPTKGMTLPFISYGGSSLLSLSVAMGILLALTRKKIDEI